MLRNSKLKPVEISTSMAETAFKQVKPLLLEYHDQQKGEILAIGYPVKPNPYDLKWLAVSCYMQGLRDCQQVLNEAKATNNQQPSTNNQ